MNLCSGEPHAGVLQCVVWAASPGEFVFLHRECADNTEDRTGVEKRDLGGEESDNDWGKR